MKNQQSRPNGEEEEQLEINPTGLPPESPFLAAPVPSHHLQGAWDGVFVNVFLDLLGIFFLITGWLFGQAGILLALGIIALTVAINTLTTLSMCAISTNGEVKTGGTYFLIARALGPEVGGSVGFLFSIGHCVALGMYCVGFAETLEKVLGGVSITGTTRWDVTIYGLILLIVLSVLMLTGVNYVAKSLLFIFVTVFASCLTVIIGAFLNEHKEEGFFGFSAEVFKENLWPHYTGNYGFFTVFAVFFPAMTGIMNGCNMSGELREPSTDIPKGTLTAVGTSAILYVIIGTLAAATVPYGYLIEDELIFGTISHVNVFIYISMFLCCFGSGCAAYLSAPQLLGALASDKLIPKFEYFAVVNKKNEPIRGYVLTFILAAVCVFIGDLEIIAPIITIFFMMTYGLLNYACYQLSSARSPGWRPSFKYYSKWTALAGAIVCASVMLLLSFWYAVISIILILVLYKVINKYKPDVNWGPANDAKRYLRVREGLLEMRQSKAHVKNYRPAYLVYVKNPEDSVPLLRYITSLKYSYGVTIIGDVILGGYDMSIEEVREHNGNGYYVDESKKLYFFRDSVCAESTTEGTRMLLQSSGIGRLRPNVFALEFKSDYVESSEDSCRDYCTTIKDAIRMKYALLMSRNLEMVTWDSPNCTGSVDVWWLIDDGGLSILIPYIMSKSKFWKRNTDFTDRATKMRLWIVTQDKSADLLTKESVEIVKFLQMLRIDWKHVELIPVTIHTPRQSLVDKVNNLTGGLYPIDKQSQDSLNRWLCVFELMEQNRDNVKLSYVTLPLPKKNQNPRVYLALLDILSEGMPTIFIRGNNTNVITFYQE